ncbi:hypothetical protein NMY22_g17375 [Coprinellus aureogranulatus]|nr:hypothetical protein NMY22_g17375 [Coprinellus aureogranulatus]
MKVAQIQGLGKFAQPRLIKHTLSPDATLSEVVRSPGSGSEAAKEKTEAMDPRGLYIDPNFLTDAEGGASVSALPFLQALKSQGAERDNEPRSSLTPSSSAAAGYRPSLARCTARIVLAIVLTLQFPPCESAVVVPESGAPAEGVKSLGLPA